MAQPAPPYYAPSKKSGSGCLVAVMVIIVFLMAVAGAVVLGVYLFATSNPGQEVLRVVGQGAKAMDEMLNVMEEGARAPGTPAMRAIGCQQALTVDMDKLLKAMDQFDAGAPTHGPNDVATFVTCQARDAASAPACDAAASTYVGAIGRAAGDFAVIVGGQGRTIKNNRR